MENTNVDSIRPEIDDDEIQRNPGFMSLKIDVRTRERKHTNPTSTTARKGSPLVTVGSVNEMSSQEYDIAVDSIESRSALSRDCSRTASTTGLDSNQLATESNSINNSQSLQDQSSSGSCEYSITEQDDTEDSRVHEVVSHNNFYNPSMEHQQSGQPTEESSQRSQSSDSSAEPVDSNFSYPLYISRNSDSDRVHSEQESVDDVNVGNVRGPAHIGTTELLNTTNSNNAPEINYARRPYEQTTSGEAHFITTQQNVSLVTTSDMELSPDFEVNSKGSNIDTNNSRSLSQSTSEDSNDSPNQVVVIEDITLNEDLFSQRCTHFQNITIQKISSFSDVSYSQVSVSGEDEIIFRTNSNCTPIEVSQSVGSAGMGLDTHLLSEGVNNTDEVDHPMTNTTSDVTDSALAIHISEQHTSNDVVDLDTQLKHSSFRAALLPHLQYLADIQTTVQRSDFDIDETDMASIHDKIIQTQQGTEADLWCSDSHGSLSSIPTNSKSGHLNGEQIHVEVQQLVREKNHFGEMCDTQPNVALTSQCDASSSHFSYISETEHDDGICVSTPLRSNARTNTNSFNNSFSLLSRIRRASNETITSHLSYSSHTTTATVSTRGSISSMVSQVMRRVRAEHQSALLIESTEHCQEPSTSLFPPHDDASISSATFYSAAQSFRDNTSSRHTRSSRNDDSQFFASASNIAEGLSDEFDDRQNSVSGHFRSTLQAICEIPNGSADQPLDSKLPMDIVTTSLYQRNLQSVVDFFADTLTSFRDLTQTTNLNSKVPTKHSTVDNTGLPEQVDEEESSVANNVDYGYSDELKSQEPSLSDPPLEFDDSENDSSEGASISVSGRDASENSSANEHSDNDSGQNGSGDYSAKSSDNSIESEESDSQNSSSGSSTRSQKHRFLCCVYNCRCITIVTIFIIVASVGTGVALYFSVLKESVNGDVSNEESSLISELSLPPFNAPSPNAPSNVSALNVQNFSSPLNNSEYQNPVAKKTKWNDSWSPSPTFLYATISPTPNIEVVPTTVKDKKSNVSCEDLTTGFLWGGRQRDCIWLEATLRYSSSYDELLCGYNKPGHSVCKKTCKTCNS